MKMRLLRTRFIMSSIVNLLVSRPYIEAEKEGNNIIFIRGDLHEARTRRQTVGGGCAQLQSNTASLAHFSCLYY